MKRSLEEIARRMNGDIPTETIDTALDEVRLDRNDIERERFRRLVSENTMILNIDDYRASAAAAAGPTAPESEITAIAWNMKEDGH